MQASALWVWRHARKRADRRWTQQYAARWAGVSVRQWRRYETGEHPIPQWLALAVARSRPLAGQRITGPVACAWPML